MHLAYVFTNGDAVLITTFLLLIGMSIASWYIIILKFRQLKAESGELSSFLSTGKLSSTSGLIGALFASQGSVPSAKNAEENTKFLHLALSQQLEKTKNALDSGLIVLATVGSSAPFIGLFGTVWGIYRALMEISAEGNASLGVVAGPMGEALIATAVGLFAAIPALIAYNGFGRANRLLLQKFRHVAERIELGLHAAPKGKA